MKPIIILSPDSMSADDIAELRKNDLCVVVASEPHKVKFVDPIPSANERGKIENACIKLSRILLSGNYSNVTGHKSDFAMLYVQCLMEGTALDTRGTRAEQEENIYQSAKADELRKLAREEAKRERVAKKKAAEESAKALAK